MIGANLGPSAADLTANLKEMQMNIESYSVCMIVRSQWTWMHVCMYVLGMSCSTAPDPARETHRLCSVPLLRVLSTIMVPIMSAGYILRNVKDQNFAQLELELHFLTSPH